MENNKSVYEHMTITNLRKIVRHYNMHVKIKDYAKKTKEELIVLIMEKLHVMHDGKIMMNEKAVERVHEEIVHYLNPKKKPSPKKHSNIPKKLSPKKETKKLTPKKASPKKPSPKKASPKKASPKKESPKIELRRPPPKKVLTIDQQKQELKRVEFLVFQAFRNSKNSSELDTNLLRLSRDYNILKRDMVSLPPYEDFIKERRKEGARLRKIEEKERKEREEQEEAKNDEPKKGVKLEVAKEEEPKKEEPKKEELKIEPLYKLDIKVIDISKDGKDITIENEDGDIDIISPEEYAMLTGKGNKDLINKNIEFFKIVEDILRLKSPYTFQQNKDKYNERINKLLGKDFEDVAGAIRSAQKAGDFYPTPYECLENKDFKRSLSQAINILEPTAGIGYILNYIRIVNPSTNMTAIEFYLPMVDAVKALHPDVIINPDRNNNFLNYYPKENKFDCIFINPPFTYKGIRYDKGLNNIKVEYESKEDSRYFLDFLFHSLYILNDSKVTFEKVLNIICPNITKDNKKGIELSSIVSYAGKPKMKMVLEKYGFGKFTDSRIKKFFEFDDDNEDWVKFSDMFDFIQCNHVGTCKNFAGTGVTAEMYQLFIRRYS